ncbi:MAG: hypothetical protein KJZ96_16045 [Rhodocyclaceae bacterium]|nr:hypothetical protein [Rhodocyclaceae bacterium]
MSTPDADPLDELHVDLDALAEAFHDLEVEPLPELDALEPDTNEVSP